MQQRQRSPAALVLLALVLVASNTAVDAVRTRSMAFAEARARRPANYIGSEDAATAHRKLLQLPKSPSAQIFLDGILQDAKLDTACTANAATPAGAARCGGSLTVNNIAVTVPKNLMVFFPANALTWQEMFNGGLSTGLALNDPPAVQGATYTVSVTANRVGNQIIAALIDLTQDATSTGSGYIDAIDYVTGTLTIETNGGAGAKVRLNDPLGRYGLAQSAGMDDRFCVDPDNPTIRSATGFPMCIPRWDPSGPKKDDPDCPTSTSRPTPPGGVPPVSIQMGFPPLHPKASNPDPTKMVPFMVGDYVTYAGVLTGSGFFSAYEIVNNVAIYTQPGMDPAYTVFETALIGTGGLNALGVGEAAIRSRYEGFTTDFSRPVNISALDLSPADGTFTRRDLGQTMPDPGPPNGAVKGRWRFRPPCTNTGPLTDASPYLGNKGCTPPAGGVYTPPTREVMAEVWHCMPVAGAVNGITSGDAAPAHAGCMYRNPAIEYIWPENVPGSPIVENNFGAIPFLVHGGYISGKGTLVGALDPWPSNALPADSCVAPTIKFPTTLTATSNGSVVLSAIVTGPSSPFTYDWSPLSANGGASPNNTLASPTFFPVTADNGTTTTSYTLTVTNACGTTTSGSVNVTVTAAVGAAPGAKDVLLAIPAATFGSGSTKASLTASLSSGTGKFAWALPADFTNPSQAPLAGVAAANSTINFTVPVIALGTMTPSKYSVNVTGGSSDVGTVDVSVAPPPDTVAITAIAFRCDKHRLTLTASSNVVNAALQLALQPYTDNNGKMFDPASLGGNTFLNGGGGTYTMTIEPVPLPSRTVASLQAVSSLSGKSVPQAVTNAQIKPASGNTPCSI